MSIQDSIGPCTRTHKAAAFSAPTGDPYRNDLLARSSTVERLAHLLATSHGNLSVAVDGDWGSGKSCLLKMVAAALRQQGVRCCEVDAWQSDFAADPIIPLIHGVAASLGDDEALAERVRSTGMALLAAAVQRGLDRLPKELLASRDATPHVQAPISASAPWKSYIEAQDARSALKDLLREMAQRRDSASPIVVIVDELDRCRPDFAIELLERMKHVLSSESVTFLFGVNVSAMARTVEGFYGPGYGGRRYLDRFFDLVHELHPAPLDHMIDHEVSRLWPGETITPQVQDALVAALKESANLYALSPRQIRRIASHVRLSSALVPIRSAMALPPAAQLVALSHANSESFAGTSELLLKGGQPSSPPRQDTIAQYGGRYAYIAIAALSVKRTQFLESILSAPIESDDSHDYSMHGAKDALRPILQLNKIFKGELPDTLLEVRAAIVAMVHPACASSDEVRTPEPGAR